MYATNIVGKHVDEHVLSKSWAVIEANFKAVVDGPAIAYAKGQVYREALDQRELGERLGLPLSDEEGMRVTMLLGATIYRPLSPTIDHTVEREGIDRILMPLALPAGA
jgi:hypothetical protein